MTMFHVPPIADWDTRITSQYGDDHPVNKGGHHGIDFSAQIETPVFATHSGTVRVSEVQHSGYGDVIVVENDELETTYAHLYWRFVDAGDKIVVGQVIGLSGNSGLSTGPHLHFGLRIKPWSRTDGMNGYSDPIYALLSL